MKSPRFLPFVAGILFVCNAYSFTWQDMWVSPDKQAEALMKEGKFAKAEELFQQAPWKAAASYRAKNYKQAAQQFGALQSESGYYNQGNALAQMGQYQEALKSYDKALALNPSNQDAIYNRKLVEELLKKNQDKQQENKNNQNQQDKSSKSDQDKKNQQNKDENNQDKQQDKKQQDNKQEAGKDNKDESGKDSKEKQDKEKQENDSKTGQKPVPAKNEKAEQAGKDQTSAAQTPEEREKQQAKEQWLKLIPDDPGGLMREKFMRDYIRRQRGWQQ